MKIKNEKVNCPHCGEDIDILINVQSGYKEWEMNKKGNYKEKEFRVDDITNEWVCPECGETIAYNEEKALKFLN